MVDSPRKRHVTVAAIGNYLMRDDGVAIHVLNALHQECPPEDVTVDLLDVGTSPDMAAYMETGVDKLIIIDAVRAHGQPGAIYRFTPDVFESEAKDITSAHDLSLKQSLAMMRLAGTLPPEVVVIGVEPATMEMGVTLSADVASKLPDIVAAVLREVRQ